MSEDSLPGYLDLGSSYLTGANDSIPGYLDLGSSYLTGANDSIPGYLDLGSRQDRPVLYWHIRDWTRHPIWPRTPTVGFAPKPTRPAGLVSVNPSSAVNMASRGADSYVLKVPWASINPAPGVYDWTLIDNALDAYGPWRMTLRIQAGDTAPGWLKDASGGFIRLYNVSRDIEVDCARWWTPVAMDAWQAMIEAAGARYDTHPSVALVSADLPMVVYSEPFILGGHHPSAQALFAAGLNLQTQTHVIKRCVSDTCRAFPTTRVELAIHKKLQYPTASGVVWSWPLGRQIALDLAMEWKHQLVFSDYGLNVVNTAAAHPLTGTLQTEPDVYAWMRLRSQTAPEDGGGPVGYQLTPRNMTTKPDYEAMAQNSLDHGGWYVETSGWATLGDDFTFYDNAHKAQSAGGQ